MRAGNCPASRRFFRFATDRNDYDDSLSGAMRSVPVWLPVIRIPSRSRMLVMIFDAFIAYALEIAVFRVSHNRPGNEG
jgi:hypothetical protein